jgi:hypothetical protein
MARRDGDSVELRNGSGVGALRMAAAERRNGAQSITPVLVCLLCCLIGCAKAPPAREFSANFNIQAGDDGSTVIWSLEFSLDQYHAMLDSTADGAERAKVRELVAAGLQTHHMVGCSPRERVVTRLSNGNIAFVGSCTVAARAVPAGGI